MQLLLEQVVESVLQQHAHWQITDFMSLQQRDESTS
jgi:hypothetical protein